ncbi:ataxin-10 isoform X1 [Osmia lignaria lignaria]|uniref:ataxin-10 isoform X1 n=1 Tax=Osmia lignaria lignaria TaxID=1437193 RepID=UPI001478D88E|nr:ataxin-10 isoform X1 [Osmia lignaria]
MNTAHINLLPLLESFFNQGNWSELSNVLNPKLFTAVDSEELIALPVLAKVAQILTMEDSVVPNNIKITCLKCLGNSCFNSYIHKEYTSNYVERGKFCNKLYMSLATNYDNLKEIFNLYSYDCHFPYEGVIEWTLNYIKTTKSNELLDDQLEILRLSIQFLCNLFTFAYKGSTFPDQCDIPQYLYDTNLKSIIINLIGYDHIPLVRASCMFIHNALKKFEGKNFTEQEKAQLCSRLLKPIKEGLESAKETLLVLLCQTNILQNTYDDMIIQDKLYLLEVIYNELLKSVYESKEKSLFTKETIDFLIERFCKISDLILKTADADTDEMEPTEAVILLDILGVLTCESSQEYSFLKSYRNLLINCTYLLKSMQTIGKQSKNYFTPLQRLSDIAPAVHEMKINESKANGAEHEAKINATTTDNIRSHPAYGFKAGLIRIIGNMAYKNKQYQDMLREMNGVPLLLDCCNIDAKNPLIMQWTILALRNLCEDNPENQEIIQNCTRVGIVENSVLMEVGLTLHEDEEGKKIGIVPLPRDQK